MEHENWKGKKSHLQYHLLLAVRVFGFDLQLLYILVSDLWSFSGAPALVGCCEIKHTRLSALDYERET